jgi:hypothetical protein
VNAYLPATPTEVAADTADVQGLTALAQRRLMGFSLRDTAGGVASVLLKHGTGTGDPLIGAASVPANSAHQQWFGPNGIAVPDGVFVDRTAGTSHLVLYWLIGN